MLQGLCRFVWLLLVVAPAALWAAEVRSPDTRIAVSVIVKEDGSPWYSLTYGDETFALGVGPAQAIE